MTIVRTIDQIVEWLNTNVCPEVEMKIPPKDKQPTNGKYDYQLVHPHAFPLYLPTKDKLPPGVRSTFPSICVQLEYGSDAPESRTMNISLGFGGWNPGIHADDWIIPEGYVPEEGETDVFLSEAEGWRDLWNFVDRTIAKIQSTTYMGQDVEVMHYEGMEFGPYKEEDSIPNYYPYWFAYLNFKVCCPLRRNNVAINELL